MTESTADGVGSPVWSPSPMSRRLLPPLAAPGAIGWRAATGQSVRAAFGSLVTRRLWSAVTMLGIVLGVCGTLAIDSLEQAQGLAIAGQMARLGSNVITIAPWSATHRGARLTTRDLAAIRETVAGLVAISPEVSSLEWLVAGRPSWEAQVVGVDPIDQRIRNDTARSGRLLIDFDEATKSRTAVIGQTVSDRLFEGRDPIGATIRIRGVAFEVVGVLAPKGHSAQADLDDLVLVPFSTAEQRLDGDAGLSQIVIQAADGEDIPSIIGVLTTSLRQEHRLRPGEANDFQITNQQALIDLSQQQTAFFARMMATGALIALILGGVGVTNLMLMAVAERRPEIGLRLAVGAQPRDVQVQFLIEAIAVTALGGAIGTLAGILASAAIPRVVQSLASYPALPSPPAVGVALLASVLIGLAFGFYPAWKASRLDPIEALRDV